MTSDPRDKEFAFINLLPDVPASLQADYNTSAPGLFREVPRLLLEDYVGLGLLAGCEAEANTISGSDHSRMPSWIPDWSCARRCEPLPGGLSQFYNGDSYTAGMSRASRFTLHASNTHQRPRSSLSLVLSLTG
jgi:hypothetical protein